LTIDYFPREALPKADIRFCGKYKQQKAMSCGVIATSGLFSFLWRAGFLPEFTPYNDTGQE